MGFSAAVVLAGCDEETTTPSQTFALYVNIQTSHCVMQGGTVVGTGDFLAGASIELVATPHTDFTFEGWYDGENKLSYEPNYRFYMANRNLSLTAKFTRRYFDVSVILLGNGTINLTVDGEVLDESINDEYIFKARRGRSI